MLFVYTIFGAFISWVIYEALWVLLLPVRLVKGFFNLFIKKQK
jgi:hypothetical protein